MLVKSSYLSQEVKYCTKRWKEVNRVDKITQRYLAYEQKIKDQIPWLNSLSAKELVEIILREAESNTKLPHRINKFSRDGAVVEFKIREQWIDDKIYLLSSRVIRRTISNYHGNYTTHYQESEYSEIEGLCYDLVKFITDNGIYAMDERFNDRTDKLIAEM